MINRVFAVYDSKTEAFLQPFFSEATGSAIRAFKDACQEKTSPIGKHPEDYQLYEVGTFDTLSGAFVATSPIKSFGIGADFVEGSNG